MTNNLEDFEQPDLESGGGLPPPQGMRANLTRAWRTRPLFKLLVLMIVVGAVIAVSISLFSSGPQLASSRIAPPPTGIHEAPGGPASPYFNRETEEASAQRAKDAMRNGGSAIATPIGQNNNIDEMNADKQKKDPLVELRDEVQRQQQQITQMQQKQAPPKPPEQFDDSLAQAMQQQMKQLMDSWVPHGVKQVVVTKEDADADKKAAAAGGTTNNDAASTAQNQPKTVVAAGTVSYAQLLTEANSDVPGPILAQIVSGPLSGARAVGSFKVLDDYLVLQFTLANLKGKDYQINAIALDPDTTLGGLATEVDQRYFTRVILPAAAGFMQGLGSALGQGSSSIVTNGTTTIVQQSGKGLQEGAFQGLSQAGQSMSQFFQNQANSVKPLVRVAAGTPMGFFFVSTVTDQAPTYGQPGMGGYGYPGYGYPGYGYQGYGNGTMQELGYNGRPGFGSNLSYPGAAGNVSYPGAGYYGGASPYVNNATTLTPAYTTLPNGTVVSTTPNSGIGTTVVTH